MHEYTSWRYKIFSTLGVLLHIIFIDTPIDIYRYCTRREKDVTNQVVVITGGASGLGRRMAYVMAVEKKAKVVIIDVNEEALRDTVDEIEKENGRIRWWKADITDHVLLDRVALEIEDEMGPVSIVICNAAVLFFGFFLDLTTEQLKKAMDVNIMGTINTIRSFLCGMEKRREGHVVAVSSIAGHAGETFGLAYCPTKFAVRGVMECLQMEMRDRGLDIKCTTLCPYFARTPMILNTGMRPTSTWIPFMSVNTCSKKMVSAILEEQVVAFIPSFVGVVAFIKNLSSQRVLRSLREYLNCRYSPPSLSSSTRSLLSMTDYFKSVHIIWWFIIPPALIINFLAFYAPDSLRVIPGVGNAIADFSKSYPQVVVYTNQFAILAHLGEGIVALFLSVKAGHSFSTAFKWFIQTFIMGFPSLRIILNASKKTKKGKKN